MKLTGDDCSQVFVTIDFIIFSGLFLMQFLTPYGAMPSEISRSIKDGDLKSARRQCLSILSGRSNDIAALILLGQIRLAEKRPICALPPLRRAVRLFPGHVACLLLVECLRQTGHRADALAELAKVAATTPDNANACFVTGAAFETLGKFQSAEIFYRRSLKLNPDYSDAWHRLGRLIAMRGDTAPANDILSHAIALRSNNPDYYVDYSSSLASEGRFQASLAAAEQALRLSPDYPAALHNLGHALLSLNRSEKAVEVLRRAISQRPDHASSHFSYAVALLKAGRTQEGWPEYEWRWRYSQTPRQDIAAQLWQGEALDGRRILLHSEQGYGDSLQFIRFAQILAQNGADVTVQVPPALTRLFQSVMGIKSVLSELPSDHDFDFHCPLASLPFRLDINYDRLPGAPYLRPFSSATSKRRRPDSREMVVGLVWAGASRPEQIGPSGIDRRRSMHPSLFAPLLSVPGIRFVSFQTGLQKRQMEETVFYLPDAVRDVVDFADTAERLHETDLLITVDTSIAHLAGGMGHPVWMLSRFDGCWRWLENRTDTPWYPSMKIIRQPSSGDWESVIHKARDMLLEMQSTFTNSVFEDSKIDFSINEFHDCEDFLLRKSDHVLQI